MQKKPTNQQEKPHHEPKASLSLAAQTEKELDLLEGMQRTAQKESAGRAFSYQHKTQGLQATADTANAF